MRAMREVPLSSHTRTVQAKGLETFHRCLGACWWIFWYICNICSYILTYRRWNLFLQTQFSISWTLSNTCYGSEKQAWKQRFFHDEVSYERSRRDSATILLRKSLRVFLFRQKWHFCPYRQHILLIHMHYFCLIKICGKYFYKLYRDVANKIK